MMELGHRNPKRYESIESTHCSPFFILFTLCPQCPCGFVSGLDPLFLRLGLFSFMRVKDNSLTKSFIQVINKHKPLIPHTCVLF